MALDDDQPGPAVRHGFTPSSSPFASPTRCRVQLARRTCPWSRDEHPDLPPEDVDAFGYRRPAIPTEEPE